MADAASTPPFFPADSLPTGDLLVTWHSSPNVPPLVCVGLMSFARPPAGMGGVTLGSSPAVPPLGCLQLTPAVLLSSIAPPLGCLQPLPTCPGRTSAPLLSSVPPLICLPMSALSGWLPASLLMSSWSLARRVDAGAHSLASLSSTHAPPSCCTPPESGRSWMDSRSAVDDAVCIFRGTVDSSR